MNCKKNLYEIFPNMDETKDTGLTVVDGICIHGDHLQQYEFLDTELNEFYFPENVKGIAWDFNMFNCPGEEVDTMVITTNLKDLPNGLYMIHAIKNFYIVDATTKDVVFYTNKFVCEDEIECVTTDVEIFDAFCKDYSRNSKKTINDSKYNLLLV